MPILDIYLFGDFRLSFNGKPITTVVQARQQAFLSYLLLHRHAPQSRQHLAFLFWPDASEAQAYTNLRNLFYKLRQALPDADHFVQSETHTVQWQEDAPYTFDVADFEAALAQAESREALEQATRLYTGDLLPSCYDDWIVGERERLRQLALDGLTRLVELLESERDYRAAIGSAEGLLSLDPVNETTYRSLMRLHAADGDRAGALGVFQRCVETLRVELDVEPSPATRELHQRLLAADQPAPPPSLTNPDQLPLVGRAAEWAKLQELWFAASSGKPQCVVLSGEAGIGKTRLAEELLGWVDSQGFVTATAHCYAAEGTLAYAPVVSWLRSTAISQRLARLEPVWLGQVARLAPELLVQHPALPNPGTSSDSWQRQNLFEALARALLCSADPMLLFVDDLQWADQDTLEWLHYLLRFNGRARLLLMATVRAEDAATNPYLQSFLSALRREGQIAEIEIGPLNASESAAVAEAVAGVSLSHEDAGQLFQETEGNPLFLVESVRAGGWIGESGQRGSTTPYQLSAADSRALPPRVHAVIHTRLAQLSPQAREVAGLAGAIGRAFDVAVLARASDQSDEMLVASLDELWQRRIVRERGGDLYDFTHDKLREVAYASLSAARRRLLHRRIAQALEAEHRHALDGVAGQVAVHYELGGALAQAVPSYQRAGEAAERVYAHAEAIQHFRRALALLAGVKGEAETSAVALYERQADILHWTGQYEDARVSFQQALASVPGSDYSSQARLYRKMGNTWREAYHYEEALHAYAAAERALGGTPPGEHPGTPAAWQQEWIQISLEVIYVYYWLGRVDESDALRPKLQAAVEQYGTPDQRAFYFQSIGWLEFRRNRSVATAEVVALVNSGLAAHQEAGNQADIPSSYFGVGFTRLWSGDPQEAIKPIQTALSMAEQTGDITLQARCLAYLTVAHRQCGQLAETEKYAAHTLAVATAAHMPEYIGMAWANQSWLAWCRNDLQTAEECGQTALTTWRQLSANHASLPFQWIALWPLIVVTLHTGQIAAAIGHASALLDPARQRVPAALEALLVAAIQHWEQGDSQTAGHLLEEAETLAQEMNYL